MAPDKKKTKKKKKSAAVVVDDSQYSIAAIVQKGKQNVDEDNDDQSRHESVAEETAKLEAALALTEQMKQETMNLSQTLSLSSKSSLASSPTKSKKKKSTENSDDPDLDYIVPLFPLPPAKKKTPENLNWISDDILPATEQQEIPSNDNASEPVSSVAPESKPSEWATSTRRKKPANDTTTKVKKRTTAKKSAVATKDEVDDDEGIVGTSLVTGSLSPKQQPVSHSEDVVDATDGMDDNTNDEKLQNIERNAQNDNIAPSYSESAEVNNPISPIRTQIPTTSNTNNRATDAWPSNDDNHEDERYNARVGSQPLGAVQRYDPSYPTFDDEYTYRTPDHYSNIEHDEQWNDEPHWENDPEQPQALSGYDKVYSNTTGGYQVGPSHDRSGQEYDDIETDQNGTNQTDPETNDSKDTSREDNWRRREHWLLSCITILLVIVVVALGIAFVYYLVQTMKYSPQPATASTNATVPTNAGVPAPAPINTGGDSSTTRLPTSTPSLRPISAALPNSLPVAAPVPKPTIEPSVGISGATVPQSTLAPTTVPSPNVTVPPTTSTPQSTNATLTPTPDSVAIVSPPTLAVPSPAPLGNGSIATTTSSPTPDSVAIVSPPTVAVPSPAPLGNGSIATTTSSPTSSSASIPTVGSLGVPTEPPVTLSGSVVLPSPMVTTAPPTIGSVALLPPPVTSTTTLEPTNVPTIASVVIP